MGLTLQLRMQSAISTTVLRRTLYHYTGDIFFLITKMYALIHLLFKYRYIKTRLKRIFTFRNEHFIYHKNTHK